MTGFVFDDTRKPLAQGDMYLIPILAIPADAKPMAAEGGHYILTHSETGHHHVVLERPDVRQFSAMDTFKGFLEITGDEPTELIHLRDTHTHAPQIVTPGAWLIQRQAAYTPQGWERARD